MGSPISFSTSCSRISTNSRFENTASHSFFGNPTRISLCIEWPSWPSPSEGTLKEDLKPAEEDFFAITAPCAALSCQISQETVSQRKGVRRKDALKRRLQTTPYLSRWPNRFVNQAFTRKGERSGPAASVVVQCCP